MALAARHRISPISDVREEDLDELDEDDYALLKESGIRRPMKVGLTPRCRHTNLRPATRCHTHGVHNGDAFLRRDSTFERVPPLH